MFVCTFRYRPKHVACYLCTEYKQKQGCTLPVCPWLAERIEAGVVGYQEAVMATIPRNRLLAPRLRALVASFPGSLWKDGTHKERMEYAMCFFPLVGAVIPTQGYSGLLCRPVPADLQRRAVET